MLVAEMIRAHRFTVPMGKGVMPVVEVGTVPRHAELVEPGGAKFGFKTFAEIAFGLGIEVDASSCVHIFVGSFSFMSSGFGRRTSRGGGVAAKIGFRAGAGAMPVGAVVDFDTDDGSSQCVCARR